VRVVHAVAAHAAVAAGCTGSAEAPSVHCENFHKHV
jgi:hypothetical protein